MSAELQKYKNEYGAFMRRFALENLNIKKCVENYLEIYYANADKCLRDTKLITCANEIY